MKRITASMSTTITLPDSMMTTTIVNYLHDHNMTVTELAKRSGMTSEELYECMRESLYTVGNMTALANGMGIDWGEWITTMNNDVLPTDRPSSESITTRTTPYKLTDSTTVLYESENMNIGMRFAIFLHMEGGIEVTYSPLFSEDVIHSPIQVLNLAHYMQADGVQWLQECAHAYEQLLSEQITRLQ